MMVRSATALVLSALLALPGCVELVESLHPGGGGERALETSRIEPPSDPWSAGHWWGYKATFNGNRTFHIALIVFEEHPQQFVIGSNLTAGFFGLPFNGNVTRPNLNPIVAGEEWRLYDFPLTDGKRWHYSFMGYPLTAEAHATALPAFANVPEHAGFHVTARSYGRLVAEYTYSPVTGWFTSLILYEPTNGQRVIEVSLEAFGENFDRPYYVNVPLYRFDTPYPGIAGPQRFTLDEPYLSLTTLAVIKATGGQFQMRLENPEDRTILDATVTGHGVAITRRATDSMLGSWDLEHLGAGVGDLHVEITGLREAQGSTLATSYGATRAPPSLPASLQTQMDQWALTLAPPTQGHDAPSALAGNAPLRANALKA